MSTEPRLRVTFGPMHATAWAAAVVRFWKHCFDRGAIDPCCEVDIIDLVPESGARRLLLREIGRQALELRPGFAPRVRYIPLECPSARGRNPVVVLANGAWSRLPQRLLAMHYGLLLEPAPASGDEWHPARTQSWWGGQLRAVLERYRVALNSAPVVISEGARQVANAMAGGAAHLVLSLDDGHVADKQVRSCGFDDVLANNGQAGRLPVDFQLLAAQFRDAGAVTWQRQLPGTRAIQVAVAGVPEMDSALEAAVMPLRDGRFADAALLARNAAVVGNHGHDADAVLALLRQSCCEPAVFLAACPDLLRLLETVVDREPWADALDRVWRNRHAARHAGTLYREIARAGMQIAEWGLARRALRWGRRVHGDAAEDLALLAWCEANSGGLERAQRLLDRLALRWPANAAGRDLLARLQSRFADFHRDPRRRPIEHPTLPLVLEPLHPDHAFALHRQYRDPQIAVMAGLDDLPTVDQARQWIEKRRGLGQHADFAVMHRHAGLVGCVGLRFRRPAAGLVYWIGAEHQGKGFGTAAAHLLCTWGLTQGLGWIFTSTYRDNLRSIMALERIGFRRLAGPRASDGQCVFMGWPAQDESATTQAFSGYLDAEDRESRD